MPNLDEKVQILFTHIPSTKREVPNGVLKAEIETDYGKIVVRKHFPVNDEDANKIIRKLLKDKNLKVTRRTNTPLYVNEFDDKENERSRNL